MSKTAGGTGNTFQGGYELGGTTAESGGDHDVYNRQLAQDYWIAGQPLPRRLRRFVERDKRRNPHLYPWIP